MNSNDQFLFKQKKSSNQGGTFCTQPVASNLTKTNLNQIGLKRNKKGNIVKPTEFDLIQSKIVAASEDGVWYDYDQTGGGGGGEVGGGEGGGEGGGCGGEAAGYYDEAGEWVDTSDEVSAAAAGYYDQAGE